MLVSVVFCRSFFVFLRLGVGNTRTAVSVLVYVLCYYFEQSPSFLWKDAWVLEGHTEADYTRESKRKAGEATHVIVDQRWLRPDLFSVLDERGPA